MAIIGSYELIRQLGEGGFGRTYEGRHILDHDIKACLKQNINVSEADTKLLLREAWLMSQVNHYSLPAFRDLVKVKDGSYVLIMSFVEGRTLDKIIEKHKALHPEEVSWIAQRSLNALFYLHNKGIIHGDVKPPNLIIDHHEHNATLVDYGLSTFQPGQASKAEGYTAVFAAPEIISGNPPLPQSDLYSLGLTMIYAWGGDPIAKTNPEYVPAPLQQFVTELVRYEPLERTSWEKEDLVKKLSDVRLASFGRRHSQTK
ncbi:MAG: serine/threonine-protein kinase [Candidatus Woesearchaeota archaeon]